MYWDIRGGFAGTGIITNDPGQEATSRPARLTSTSPCIDKGTTNSFPGFHLFTRYDMDGEARLDHTPANAQEIHDLEGISFEPATTNLCLVTSHTKRNRYRDVDSSPPIAEALADPPSNDYDRRRNVLVCLQLGAELTTVTKRTFYESENMVALQSVGYEPTNGLIAFLREQLSANGALGEVSHGTRVLIATNRFNKFGTPQDGHTYGSGEALPYSSSGLFTNAGCVLTNYDSGSNSGSLTITGLASNQAYF